MSVPTSLLCLDHLNKAFGSLVVTDDICLDIAPGERHVIIGPNGAGKTSLVNQIGGQLRPSSGRILLKDRDITGLTPDRISRLGVARTFQRNNLFQNLGVIENIRLALEVQRGSPLNFFAPVAHDRTLSERAEALMAQVHLVTDGARPARQLSYGEQRQLEIGIALAGAPELLLLDEPTSGMSPTETARMIDLIGTLPRTLSILMIEHDMNVVFSVADRITVLYYGKVLATGTPADIQADARVREVYLGMVALMLELENINAYYGDSHILHGVSFAVRPGEVVCLLGRNGAGKTTTILTIMGYLKPQPGRIRYDGRDIAGLPPYAVARLGFGFVPQERGVFPSLTVRENLTVFARAGRKAGRELLDTAAHLRFVSGITGARAQSRLSVVRRRAANAVDRTGADAQSGFAFARRAVGGTGADDRAADRRYTGAAQRGGARHSAGRAEFVRRVSGRRPPSCHEQG